MHLQKSDEFYVWVKELAEVCKSNSVFRRAKPGVPVGQALSITESLALRKKKQTSSQSITYPQPKPC